MKNKFYIGLLTTIIVSISLLTVSCVKEEMASLDSEKTTNIKANITTYSPASTDTLALGAAEYVIRRCRLYAFDGNKLDNMVYFDNISTDNLGEYIARMKVTPTTTKKLYCIINEPDNNMMHNKLALINNPAAFKQIEYQIADYVNDAYNNIPTFTFSKTDFCLPMYGEMTDEFSTITSTPEIDIPISMTVTRSVARVDVYLQTSRDLSAGIIKIDNTTMFDILNTRASGYIAPYTVPYDNLINIEGAASGPTTALAIPVRNVSDNDNAMRVFTFYTPERTQESNAELGFTLRGIDYNGVRKNYTVHVSSSGENGLTRIIRNKSHKFVCTFTPAGIIVSFSSSWVNINPGSGSIG